MRSKFQEGPDRSHYHDTLGVEGLAPEGGGAIAATDGQIVFMDGTDAVGSDDFTFDPGGGNPILGLAATENATADIKTLGLGAQLQIHAADGDADHVGGEVVLQAGDSNGQSGGALSITSGSDLGGGDGGPLTIYSGRAPQGTSGDIEIRAGQADGGGPSTDGGRVLIQAGLADDGDGGGVTLQAGGSVSGTPGWVSMSSAGMQVYVDSTGIYLYGLPTVDPGIAEALWNDAGTLKVSAG